MPEDRTTIAAVSSPPGAGERGILRVSGPLARGLLTRTVTVSAGPLEPESRGAFPGRFHDGRGEVPALVLWMPGPRSYTREDVFELHLPGSPHLLQAALDRLLRLGAVPAEPGEFTRRAFESGRIDLSQAEGVLELIEARSLEQCRAATALLAGGLSQRVAGLRNGLEELRALCEASLDFDEAEAGHVQTRELTILGEAALAGLAEALRWEERRDSPRGRLRIVLCGAPNAGKSSLHNALVGSGGALVSEVAGTTRDGVEGLWGLGGAAASLLDGPGLEAGEPAPERAAQRLAERERRAADLLLWVVDSSAAEPGALSRERASHPEGTPVLLAWNKIDLPGAPARPPEGLLASLDVQGWAATSALRGEGLDGLATAAAAELALAGAGRGGGEGRGLARELSARHRQALERARAALAEGLALLAREAPLDLVAGALRESTEALDGIAGRTTPEDLLDRIFARFCLGK